MNEMMLMRDSREGGDILNVENKTRSLSSYNRNCYTNDNTTTLRQWRLRQWKWRRWMQNLIHILGALASLFLGLGFVTFLITLLANGAINGELATPFYFKLTILFVSSGIGTLITAIAIENVTGKR